MFPSCHITARSVFATRFIWASKSQIVHYRPRNKTRTEFNFKCGSDELSIVDKYVYLGLTINEFLDYNLTAKIVSQSASRALGLIIAKCNAIGGLPYDVFTKLYDSVVWPVIAYGAAIWGTRSFSCIEAVHNRAMRYFMGVGRYTPSAALVGDMGWIPPLIRQWQSICNQWTRFAKMDSFRMNKQVFMYGLRMANDNCKNYMYRIKEYSIKINCVYCFDINCTWSKEKVKGTVTEAMLETFKSSWYESINANMAQRGQGGNKLRKYKLLKQEINEEFYCKQLLPRSHRSAMAKFRAGVAPIRV